MKLLTKILYEVLNDLNYPNTEIIIEIPKNNKFGDYSTNLALILSKKIKKNPINIAEDIANHIESLSKNELKKISIAGPGFINFTLSNNFYYKNLLNVIENPNYGKIQQKKSKTALVEFVSANPTGPLTVGHGRGAVLGDTISNILEWNGYEVVREYYFNNAGKQMRVLGESVASRYKQIYNKDSKFPDYGYQGEYIKDIAKLISTKFNDNFLNDDQNKIFKESAENFVFEDIKKTLKKIKINFDSFFNEDDLYSSGAIKKTLSKLKRKKIIYEKDGATWFKAKSINREQDKVLVKSSGEPTYRLPDVAYHKDKFNRKFDLIVDIFGADHSDTYPDVMALIKSLDCDINKMKVIIHQFVTILENGEKVKMSTRKANFITLEELCDEVGEDVLRYFFIMRGANTHLNFDIGLAKNESDENPVFYLQYAYARICNILKKSNEFEYSSNEFEDLKLLSSNVEKDILRKIQQFPDLITQIGQVLEPQTLANYLQSLASLFHKFYSNNKVISDDEKLSFARLKLICGIKHVLKNGLDILGINAPEKM